MDRWLHILNSHTKIEQSSWDDKHFMQKNGQEPFISYQSVYLFYNNAKYSKLKTFDYLCGTISNDLIT